MNGFEDGFLLKGNNIVSPLSKETKDKILELIKKDQNRMIGTKKDILNQCVKEKLIKKNEIKNFSQNYLVEFMSALLKKKTNKVDIPKEVKDSLGGGNIKSQLVYVTINKPILKRREELNNRFNEWIIVVDLAESKEMMEEEMECDCEDYKAERKEKINYIG